MTKQVNIEDKWFDVPDIAEYVAQDRNGDWWWYEVQPTLGEDSWGGLEADYGCIVQESSEDWKEELYELVDVE